MINSEGEKRSKYDFHESIVNALRPAFKEGIRSIVVASPARTAYARDLLDHITRHHAWLVRAGPNAATFEELIGSAGQPHEVHELVRTKKFRDVIGETRSQDAENITTALDRSLDFEDSEALVLYSLEEIEDLIYGRQGQRKLTPNHVVLTDRYYAEVKSKRRVERLLQISKNKGIKTTIVSAETGPGLRLSQLGGLVCFASSNDKKRK
jgi:stalled ribosome rescue protein Dom34